LNISNHILFKILIYTFFCIVFHSVYAQKIEVLELDNLNTSDGLSNEHISSIIEDDYGYIWAGSHYGLNIYDGNQNEVLNHEENDTNSLSGDNISCLLKRLNGNIAVGTWGEGINLITPISKKVSRLPKRELNPKNTIKTLVEDSDSNLWIGTFGGGIYKYENKTGNYLDVKIDPSYDESSHYFKNCQNLIVHKNKVWAFSWKDGLATIDIKTGILTPILISSSNGIPIKNISSATLHEEIIYFGTTWGDLYSFDINTNDLTILNTFKESDGHRNKISALTFDRTNFLWVSTQSGFFQINMVSKTVKSIHAGVNGAKYNQNIATFLDSRHILWIGTRSNGLKRYNPRSHKFNTIHLSSVNPVVVNTVHKLSNNRLMLGTDQGIQFFDRKKKETSPVVCTGSQAKNVSTNEIKSICDYNDDFLVGTSNGLFRMDKNFECDILEIVNQENFFASDISCMAKVGHEIWIGSLDNGILILNEIEGPFYRHYSSRLHPESKLHYDEIFSFLPLANENVLIGLLDGIMVFNRENDSFDWVKIISAKDNKEHSLSKIKAMAEDKYGNLNIIVKLRNISYLISLMAYLIN